MYKCINIYIFIYIYTVYMCVRVFNSILAQEGPAIKKGSVSYGNPQPFPPMVHVGDICGFACDHICERRLAHKTSLQTAGDTFERGGEPSSAS